MTVLMLKNAALLALSGFCAKGFDFLFRAYYSRFLGQEGMGILSLGFSIHGVMITVATAGFGVAVSKVVSENIVKKDFGAIGQSMNFALRSVFVLSSVVMIFIFCFAEWIAEYILKEPRVSSGLFCLAPSILFMGISYCLKGYFYAKRKVAAPALSEFLEQAVKGILICIFLSCFLSKGVQYGCAGVFLGITLGELSSCFFLFLCFLRDKQAFVTDTTQKSVRQELIKVAFPTMVTSLTGSLLRMQEEVLIVNTLRQFGFTQREAVANLGIVYGMVVPMLVFPLTLIGSVSTLLVPEISRANALQNKKRLFAIIKKIYAFAIASGLVVMMVFLLYAESITGFVYNDVTFVHLVQNLSVICPLIFLESLSCSILNGLGKQFSLLCYNLIDSVLRLLGIYLIVPVYGIYGIVVVIISSSLFACLITVIAVSTNTNRLLFLNAKKIKRKN